MQERYFTKERLEQAAKSLEDAAHYLVTGLRWSETPEGMDYWAAQNSHFKAMAEHLRELAEEQS